MPLDQLDILEVSGLNDHKTLPEAGSKATRCEEGINPISLLPIITGLKYRPAPLVLSSILHTSLNCPTFAVSTDDSNENLLLDASWPNVGHSACDVEVSFRPQLIAIIDKTKNRKHLITPGINRIFANGT